jgi:hypothetical protein
MSDPWVHSLSDYIDGELPAEDRAELERHLAQCDACAGALKDLRHLVDQAGELEDLYPRRDLWAGIAAHIGAETVPGVEELEEDVARSMVVSLDAPPRRRAFSFSAVQLMAAALALMIVSGAVGYLLRDTAPQTRGQFATNVTPSGDTASSDVVAAGAESTPAQAMVDQIASLEKRITELQTTFEQYGKTLDPDVYATLEDSLFLLDEAIADWRGALTEDPQNEFVYAHLANSLMRKVRLLQQASQIASTEI